ncbi:amidase [Sulfuriferula sp. AH1]|uniref:acetamidase/formamidase family protein n=1 Tax=Sulfuriferula sp. AH1 TaxID=1985873 RepID=UPI000B3BA91C|nr:acetamidase/formamidase family protein [Sulfuriferula sp. AH1]ARU31385.1 amidase [Sulfuriferula sp. AH1]
MKSMSKWKLSVGLALAGATFGVGAYTYEQLSMEEKLRIVPAAHVSGKLHLLPATMETTQWGWFDNAQTPVMTIMPGDTVALETMMHSHNQIVPGTTLETIKKLRIDNPGRGPHTLTGPIFVEGAEPGDVLKIHINKIMPRSYATNFNIPGMFGEFPKEFQDGQVKYFYLDMDKKVTEFAPGIEIPLHPFPGTIGVARAEPGKYSSVPPGPFGGNMDIRELTEGTTLYLPVFVKGALLWSGDSHAAQGNGEINLTALETAFKEMNITVDVIKGTKLDWPRIETSRNWITMGYDNDLNKAWDIAKAETGKYLGQQRGISPEKAVGLMQKVSDCRISEVVNIKKGVYCMNPKDAKSTITVDHPVAETNRYWVTTATDADLNKAMDQASMAMIGLLQEKKGLSRLDSYGLASMSMDCRLGDLSDDSKSVHCLMPKSLWVAKK